MKKILLILDGWGIGKPDKFNAIANAKTPNMDYLMSNYGYYLAQTYGHYVGLDDNNFGTSEINHMTIGTGEIIWQDLPKINEAIKTKSLNDNLNLNQLISHVISNHSTFHLCGILSDGGVHSHINHLIELINILNQKGVSNISLHLFADGRDTAPKSILKYLEYLKTNTPNLKYTISTITGRFWLDRDREWSRTEKVFNTLTSTQSSNQTFPEFVNDQYENKNYNDEHLDPYIFANAIPLTQNDVFFMFHFRSDRQYQLLKLIQDKMPNVKLGNFSSDYDDIAQTVLFTRQTPKSNIAEILSEENKTQIHITETEKYTHLTYFFNAGAEKELPNEKWELLESNRFIKPDYNFDPMMRADAICQTIINCITNTKEDFILANFANTDMIGHTGNYEAAIIGAEAVDMCVGKIYNIIKTSGEYELIITADHGNSDEMWDYVANQPHTRHTFNPVPIILINTTLPNNICVSNNQPIFDIPNGYIGEIKLTDIKKIICQK